MILYDPADRMGFFEFGIQIPILDSKVTRTYQRITEDPALGPLRDVWHISRIDEVIDRLDLKRVHSRNYVDRLFSEKLEEEIIRTYELIDEQGRYYRYNPDEATEPLPRLFKRILTRVAGTTQCYREALSSGFCFYFGGGMHHAHHDFGHGFCLLNDIMIGLRKLQAENRIQTAWVIDVDAHKGDGTAALAQGDDTIHTLSVHMAKGWPLDGDPQDANGRPNPSFISSDVDIPIAAGEESVYNDRLLSGLHHLRSLSQPDLAVVVSGADPYEKDELPSTQELQLSRVQMRERDRLIYGFLKERQIPQASLMSGGYGPDVWEVYADFLLWALGQRLNLDPPK